MTLKYHFFNYRTVFPVQKVSFLAAKIPMGRKSFLSLSARKKRKRYRRKKCPIIKNELCFIMLIFQLRDCGKMSGENNYLDCKFERKIVFIHEFSKSRKFGNELCLKMTFFLIKGK